MKTKKNKNIDNLVQASKKILNHYDAIYLKHQNIGYYKIEETIEELRKAIQDFEPKQKDFKQEPCLICGGTGKILGFPKSFICHACDNHGFPTIL